MTSSNLKNASIISLILCLVVSISPRLGLCNEQGSHVERYKEGVELFRNSRFLEASSAFREAYKLKPSWKLWFNIAQSEASAKRYGRAVAAFERYLVGGGDEVPEGRREVVLQELDRLRPIVGVIEVDPTAPSGAQVFVDDELWGTVPLEDPIRVAAQKHTVTIKMGDQVLVERRLTVPGRGTVTILLETEAVEAEPEQASTEEGSDHTKWEQEGSVSPAREPSSRSKILFWSGVGSSVVGLGLVGMGIGFNAKYASDYESYQNATSSKKQQDYKTDILPRDRGLAVGGYVAGGVFVVAGAALIVMGILSDDEDPGEPQVTAAPGGLRIRF